LESRIAAPGGRKRIRRKMPLPTTVTLDEKEEEGDRKKRRLELSEESPTVVEESPTVDDEELEPEEGEGGEDFEDLLAVGDTNLAAQRTDVLDEESMMDPPAQQDKSPKTKCVSTETLRAHYQSSIRFDSSRVDNPAEVQSGHL
jgi:hypothetical protein